MLYVYAFFATFVYVFMRSYQQMNVVHADYWHILPTSIVMGQLDVLLIAFVVKSTGFDEGLALAYGFGGGLGSTLATWIQHERRKRANDIAN